MYGSSCGYVHKTSENSVKAKFAEFIESEIRLPRTSGYRLSRKFAPEVAKWHTKICRLAYILGSSSVLQFDQSSSRATFESSPSKEQPGFSVVCHRSYSAGASYV